MSALKNFLITFSIAALIFGIIGYFTAGYLSGVVTGILNGEEDKFEEIKSGDDGPTVSGDDDDDGYTGPMPDGESFTYLFLGTDYRPGEHDDYYTSVEKLQELIQKAGGSSKTGILSSADEIRYIHCTWMVLVRADKQKHEFAFCYITPETVVSTQSGDITLGNIYGTCGVNGLCEYISYITGISVDKAVILDGDGLVDFLDKFGEMEFDATTEVFYNEKEYVSSSVRMEPKKKDDTDKNGDTTGTAEPVEETGDVEYEEVENESVLSVGTSELSEDNIHILNEFKEYSLADIEFKNSYTVQLVRRYLERYAEVTEDEAVRALENITNGNMYTSSDPYEAKETLALNVTEDDIKNFHSMIQALSYFNIREMKYPGNYEAPYGAEQGVYYPNIEEGLGMFSDYLAD